MKKILSLMLALVLVFSMTACGVSEKENEEAAKNVVESFLSAVSNLEMDKLKDYVVDEDEIPEEFAEMSIDKVMSEMPEEMEPYSEDFKKLFGGLFDKVKDKIEYEIKDVTKEEDDKYAVSVELTMPKLDDVDIESVVEENISEEDLTAIAMRLFAEGRITVNSTQQEIMDVLMPDVINALEDVFDGIELETETEEKEFVVVKTEDDKWLIDAKESGLND